MNSRNANRPQEISQLDFGGVLRNSHDFEGQSLRVRDVVSTVQDSFTHFRVTYNSDNLPTIVDYIRGTQPHVTEVTTLSDVSGSLNNTYFLIYDSNSDKQYYVWYNVSGGGTDPLLPNALGIEVPIQTNDEAFIVSAGTEMMINMTFPRVFSAQRKGEIVVITTKKFGLTTNSSNGTTSFLVTNTLGQEELVEQVVLEYNNGNPIYEGQELIGYTYNITDGKFVIGAGGSTSLIESPRCLSDKISETIYYQGEAETTNALTSEPVWKIKKITLDPTGISDEVLIADDGNFTQIWDDRLTILP